MALRCVGWMRRTSTGREDIRHKARAGGNESEESAATGIESDAGVNGVPCSGIARICTYLLVGSMEYAL